MADLTDDQRKALEWALCEAEAYHSGAERTVERISKMKSRGRMSQARLNGAMSQWRRMTPIVVSLRELLGLCPDCRKPQDACVCALY
jgi:hypothetical protein